eukprot:Phypoly_transcript_06192.p1 GENE.Phypoly_transcript_06192~~Phypoly_transcript_06192.p1  ORF type:complete len:158 (+),score=22.93 Phypoly_transcript_06192:46-474(+)
MNSCSQFFMHETTSFGDMETTGEDIGPSYSQLMGSSEKSTPLPVCAQPSFSLFCTSSLSTSHLSRISCSQTSLHGLSGLLGLVPEEDLEEDKGLSYLHALGGSETSSPPSVCVPPDFSSHLRTGDRKTAQQAQQKKYSNFFI